MHVISSHFKFAGFPFENWKRNVIRGVLYVNKNIGVSMHDVINMIAWGMSMRSQKCLRKRPYSRLSYGRFRDALKYQWPEDSRLKRVLVSLVSPGKIAFFIAHLSTRWYLHASSQIAILLRILFKCEVIFEIFPKQTKWVWNAESPP